MNHKIALCVCVCVCVCARAHMHAQWCPTLCDPLDGSHLGSTVHWISHMRILKWVTISFSRDLPNPGIKPTTLVSPALADRFFTTVPTGKLKPTLYSAVI